MDLITISESLMKSDTFMKSNHLNNEIHTLSSVKSELSTNNKHNKQHKQPMQVGSGMDDDVPKASIFVDRLVEKKLNDVIMRTHKMLGGKRTVSETKSNSSTDNNQSKMNENILTESAKSESEFANSESEFANFESANSESANSISVSAKSESEQLGGANTKTKKNSKKRPVKVVIDKQRKYDIPKQKGGSHSDSINALLINSESSLFTVTH